MNRHSIAGRVARLSQTLVQRSAKKPTIDVTGWDHDRIIGAADQAIAPADSDVVDRIMAHVDTLHAIPWHNMTTKEKYLDSEGKEVPTPHFFTYWIWGLEAGSWHLPCQMPRAALEGFDSL